MYQVGDKVVYGVHGVCLVADHEERIIDRKKVTYLVLVPLGQDGSKYLVPTHNAAAMAKLRRMMTKEELEATIHSPEVQAGGWVKDDNQRKQVYRELISGGNCARMMQMVCMLYRHKAARNAAGRKIHLCDENFLRDAEKLLSEEAALVLGLEPDMARQYIRRELKEEG